MMLSIFIKFQHYSSKVMNLESPNSNQFFALEKLWSQNELQPRVSGFRGYGNVDR